MAKRLKPLTKSHYSVEMNGLEARFTEFSGIKESRATSEYADGVGLRVHEVAGPKKAEPVTLAVAYDPDAHSALFTEIKRLYETQEYTTVTIQPLADSDEVTPRGPATILSQCIVTGYETNDVDLTSADVVKLTVNISYSSSSEQ